MTHTKPNRKVLAIAALVLIDDAIVMIERVTRWTTAIIDAASAGGGNELAHTVLTKLA